MSFVDYGFDVFPYGPPSRRTADDRQQSCGDCLPSRLVPEPGTLRNAAKGAGYHAVIDHLIELGTATEYELARTRRELAKYQCLELSEEQIVQLQRLDAELESEDNDLFKQRLRSNNTTTIEEENENEEYDDAADSSSWEVPDAEKDKKGCCCQAASSTSVPSFFEEETKKLRENESNLNNALAEKESEILSLKNDSAVREMQLQKLVDQNRELEILMERMKDDIELLEKSSRISQSQIEDIVRQKNEEIEIARQNTEDVEQELIKERQARIKEEREIIKMQAALKEAQGYRKTLTDELKMMKRRVEALEGSNSSLSNSVKLLQQERDNLDQLNRDQENEIEKLLNIIRRLNEKFDKSKTELMMAREEARSRERQVSQCREQLETMEREVSQLISELAECLGRSDEATLPVNTYARARELTRGLQLIVREHEQCREHRRHMQHEIERLHAICQGQCPALDEMKSNVCQEIARLQRVVKGVDHCQAIKMDVKSILDEMLRRIDSNKMEKAERVIAEVANEASTALTKLGETVAECEVYQKCENYLLLHLDSLEEILHGTEKSITAGNMEFSEAEEIFRHFEENRRKLCESGNEFCVQNDLSRKMLERVQNSTQIVIKIYTALREDSVTKWTINRNLKAELEEARSALNEVSSEKSHLQHEYNECLKKCVDMSAEIESLKQSLDKKSKELESMKELQTRYSACQQELDSLHKRLSTTERRYQESRAENACLIKKGDELIRGLQSELKRREAELQDYGRFNDMLNDKMQEANRMIEQLQCRLVEERARKLDDELSRDRQRLSERVAQLEAKLQAYERSNAKLHNNLARILEENESLERGVVRFREQNIRLESSIAKRSAEEAANLGTKCELLVERFGRLADGYRKAKQHEVDTVRELEIQLDCLKEKLQMKEAELAAEQQKILEKDEQIEHLSSELKAKISEAGENSAALLKEIDALNCEKMTLKNELKQTLAKYEDNLAEMHKQYKQNETELLKKHNDSIKILEAKYLEMLNEEEKIFGSPNWLQSLSTNELQALHDRICKSPLCSLSMFEKELLEDQKKKTKAAILNKKLPAKKDVKTIKSISSTTPKTSGRPRRFSSRETVSRDSIIIPEKDYSPRVVVKK